jgi:hypothetical protein
VVGGTELAMNGNGTSYKSESTWPLAGGGVSSQGIPDYQSKISMSTNFGSTSNRNLPDVSAVADNVSVFINNGEQSVYGGTSISAPIWAAWTALANQANQQRANFAVGFINPTLYVIAQTQSQYAHDFNDIQDRSTNTSNGDPNRYKAVTGYDLATGLGTPTTNLFSAVAPPPPTSPPVQYTSIEFDIMTGEDDARGVSSIDATMHRRAATDATITWTLKTSDHSSPGWLPRSYHTSTFTLPSPMAATDLENVVITLGQHYVGGFPPETADNWDIAGFWVVLRGPDNWHNNVINLSSNRLGVPIVRLTGDQPSQTFVPTGISSDSQSVLPPPKTYPGQPTQKNGKQMITP